MGVELLFRPELVRASYDTGAQGPPPAADHLHVNLPPAPSAACSPARRGGGSAARSWVARVALSAVAALAATAGLATLQIGTSAAAAAPKVQAHHTPNTFPRAAWNVETGHIGFSSPSIGTIDGTRVVAVGSESGYLYVMNAATGAEMPGWPQKVQIAPGVGTAVDSTPTFAYLDGPTAEPSIIVGAGSLYVPDQQGGLEAFYYNGAKRFVFHTRDTFNEWAGGGPGNGYSNAVFSTPAVGDITGNGQQDIVFGSYDHYIYALTPSGALVPGFPFDNQDTIWSSPALYDVTGTGKDDMYIGADSTGLDGCWGGWLYDLRYWSGAPHVVWSHCEPQTFWSSPAIGEINTSGRAAVVVGTSWNTIYDKPSTTNRIYAFYADDGALVPGWPVATNGPTYGSPAIGDILGNGQPQVVDTTCAHCSNGPGSVEAFTGTGQHLWTTVLNDHEVLSSPILVDLTGSGYDDVVAGNTYGMYLLNGRSGGFMFDTGGSPLGMPCAVMNSAAVTDVPGVGWRLFDACGGPISQGHVMSFPLPDTPKVPPAWPEFRGDTDHDGVANDPAAPSNPGCRVQAKPFGYRFVAADGGVFSYGDVGFCGSAGGIVVAAPVVGMATTPDQGGYWLALANGTVYAFGNAQLFPGSNGAPAWGSMQGMPITAPIVGIAASVDGRGYYLVGSDGSVYTFGDAKYYGSEAGQALPAPIMAIAVNRYTGGYWLVASNGSVFSHHAPYYGSPAVLVDHSQIVGMTTDPATGGYWMVAANGAVYAYHAAYYGSMAGHALTKPIVGMTYDPLRGGYWLVGTDGGIFAFHAGYYGSTGNIHLNQPIDGMTA